MSVIVPISSALPLKADVAAGGRESPLLTHSGSRFWASGGPLVARSGHSPLSGVCTKVHFVIGIEFDAQVHFYRSRKKDAAGGNLQQGPRK